jgi:hypothetical protein
MQPTFCHPGLPRDNLVAWMKRSEIRDWPLPYCAALHAGYRCLELRI